MHESPPFPPPPDVVGFRLDGPDSYTITAELNAELCSSVGAIPAEDGTAHPIFYFIATQIGSGPTPEEFLAECAFDVADGPMVLGTAVSFQGPLMVGRPYTVRGEFSRITRKRSRKLSVMDILEYRLRLFDREFMVLETVNTIALPRKEFR